MKAWKTLGLLVVVGAGALLPLYGDPKASPVSHPEWARMVLRGLGLLDASQETVGQASQVFAALGGRAGWSFPADRYVRGDGVAVEREGEVRRVRATAAVGEVSYAVPVVRDGEYRVRAYLAGDPAVPAEAEMSRLGEDRPLQSFRMTPAVLPSWVDAGALRLGAGAYSAAVLLPKGAVLERLEVAPPCVNPIEPRGGWQLQSQASRDDVAVTVLQALELESELPPAATPIEITAGRFAVEAGVILPAAAGQGIAELRAASGGLVAAVIAQLPEDGLYTLSVFGTPGVGGQSWTSDSCRQSVICPEPEGGLGWKAVLSGRFKAGVHTFTVTLGLSAVVQRIRLEQKKDGPEDAIATLRRLGLDLGVEDPITRAKAIEARDFVGQRKDTLPGHHCFTIVMSETQVAQTSPTATSGPGGSEPGGPGTGVPPSITEPPTVTEPPVVPPPDVASPTEPLPAG